MAMRKILVIVTLLSTAALAACGHRSERRETLPPLQVRTVKASVEKLPAAEAYTGTVKSRDAVVVSTKMMGRVLRIFVEEGEAVKKGQPLVEVDAAEAQSALEQAKAGLQAADVAAANARRDLERFTALREEKAVTEHQLEQVKAGAAAAEAQKAQAEANVRMAKTLLTYGRILSPADGIVTRKWMDPGNLAYPGVPILTVENPRNLEMVVAVPEERARLLAPGQKALLAVDGRPEELVVAVASVVAAADPMSRTSSVRLDLPAGADLRPGQFARVRFEALAEQGLAVPAEALRTFGQMDALFVAEGGSAHLRYVQTGIRSQGRVQILSGLKAGEAVVCPVPEGLADGRPVEVAP